MDPELASIRDRLLRDFDRLFAALEGFNAADASWTPVPNGSSLVQLARHVLGGTEEVVTRLAGGSYARDRDREFLDPGTPEAVIASAKTSREQIAKAFESIDPAKLDQPATPPAPRQTPAQVPAVWSGGGAGPTVRDKLLERIAHVAEHAGHAELTRDLLRAATTAERSRTS